MRAGAEPRVCLTALIGLALMLGAAGCAPRMATVALPTGAGLPLDPATMRTAFEAMTLPCQGLRALTADLRIAGRVEGEKIRGTLQVGVEADAIRIEGVPPFGAPVFVMAGRSDAATLVLFREGVYIEHAPVSALTDALVGVSLSPSDLLTLLGGCGVTAAAPLGGVQFGDEWVRLDLPEGVRAWLATTMPGAAPSLRVVETSAWRVDYDQPVEDEALRGTLRRAGPPDSQLTFVVDAPERLAALPTGAMDVTIPRDLRRVPLADLRRPRALADP